MATNYFKSIYHHHHSAWRRHSIDFPPYTFSSSSSSTSLFIKPPKTIATAGPSLNSQSIITSSLSSTTISIPSTSSRTISYDLLEQHLSVKNFRQADEETRRLVIVLAGEAAQKRGYVFFSEVQFIPEDDLNIIDGLWRKYSDNKFGYSVQKKIWEKVSKDFTKLFIKLGWMKKLDTEVEQFNYKSFPNEFIWEMNDEISPPEGHLPLTNALRGTQLLDSILCHPAFDGDNDDDDDDEIVEEDGKMGTDGDKGSAEKLLSKRVFKTDYSF